jgi:hypothetical protein
MLALIEFSENLRYLKVSTVFLSRGVWAKIGIVCVTSIEGNGAPRVTDFLHTADTVPTQKFADTCCVPISFFT